MCLLFLFSAPVAQNKIENDGRAVVTVCQPEIKREILVTENLSYLFSQSFSTVSDREIRTHICECLQVCQEVTIYLLKENWNVKLSAARTKYACHIETAIYNIYI